MRTLIMLALLTTILMPLSAQGVPISVEFNMAGPFSIFGHLPVPQMNGFDYAITAEQTETGLAMQSFHIRSIVLTSEAVSLGSRLNFDVEIHLSGSAIGLISGQYLNTLIDPVNGHTRNADSQFRTVIGDFPFTESFSLGVSYDGITDSATGSPALSTVKQLPNEALTLTDGLHAQVFLWTADNRNVRADFSNLRLVVEGDASQGFPVPIPEPTTIVLLSSGLAWLGGIALRKRHRVNIIG